MVTFEVTDMSCGHCASAISRAIARIDKDARLDIRIPQQLVRISSSASAAELAEAIQHAGYRPRQVEGDAPAASPGAAVGCGCGCGCGRTTIDRSQAAATAPRSCCG